MPADKILSQVLVLNASFEPIQISTARRAMTLIAKGAAIVQEPSKDFLRSGRVAFPLPSVIRLLSYRRVPRHSRAVSRKGIFLRDGHRCQYCRDEFVGNKLTLDHVIPKSRGGKNDWGNMVAACFDCNNKKSDRTPDEAGMPLAMRPMPFGLHQKHRQAAQANPLWDRYLFY